MEMNEQLQQTASDKTCQVSLSGYDLINSPRPNKGTAFSDRERDLFDLHGLLPPHVGSLDEQIERRIPLVYTPTVGEGCQRFSEIWRKPRGLFLSYPNKDRIDQILTHPTSASWCGSSGTGGGQRGCTPIA